jgi:hypothetical protein
MFKKASRVQLRFDFKGLCTVEDLWDISVDELDVLYGQLRSEQKSHEQESLLKLNKADEILELKIGIVKDIVETKLVEAKEKEEAKAKSERKQKILAIIADKQDQDLKNKSSEELMSLINQM